MKKPVWLATSLAAGLAMSMVAHAQEPVAEAKPTAEAVAVAKSSDSKSRPLTLTVDLSSGTKITGTLTDTTNLPLKTAFGEVTVPLSEVAGIRFASKEDTSTTIVLLNGDSITGATDIEMITVDTEWGTAKINGSAITSLLFVPDLKWNATQGLNGRRWLLVDGKTGTPTGPNPGQLSGPGGPGTGPSPNRPGQPGQPGQPNFGPRPGPPLTEGSRPILIRPPQ